MIKTHTPGPWEACDPGDYSDFDGQSVVILGDDRRMAVVQGDSDEAVANARLIAAAPAMLEALRDIRSWLLDSGQLIDDGISHPAFVKANNAANAAIALATGETK